MADYFRLDLVGPGQTSWSDWPSPTVEQLPGVLSKFNQDPLDPTARDNRNTRCAPRHEQETPSRVPSWMTEVGKPAGSRSEVPYRTQKNG